jgi:sterol desaturase/sphingolipid hydroxylase (fatty acid hydroxylase superfamily)
MPSVIHPNPDRVKSIRRLGSSTFNYWFGYVANLSLVVWLVSHAWHSGRLVLGISWFVFLALVGLLSWTLTEYLLHRYVYHAWRSFLSLGHALHHEEPQALIGVPWYLTTILLIGVFALLALPFRASVVGVVMGFNWLGYIFYCICHHGSHHWNTKRGWLQRMKRHHLAHHGHPEYNWGFTSPIWDLVFRTYYRGPVRRAVFADGRPSGPVARSVGRGPA